MTIYDWPFLLAQALTVLLAVLLSSWLQDRRAWKNGYDERRADEVADWELRSRGWDNITATSSIYTTPDEPEQGSTYTQP